MVKKVNFTKDEFIQKYIELSKLATEAMEENNYKKNNKIVPKIYKLVEEYKDSEFLEDAFNELLDSQLINVKISAAYRSLKFGFNEKKAEKVLKEMSKRTDIGINAFEAEINLKMHRERKRNK